MTQSTIEESIWTNELSDAMTESTLLPEQLRTSSTGGKAIELSNIWSKNEVYKQSWYLKNEE